MRLSRLEIFGFKSFAKKLDLRMTGGITSIVGPNGCGKTNVIDAIRWVLGEQRPSMIRLERMEDVLFKGSSTRRQLGMSEVSLTIENDAGILPLTMPEVTITRRLYRSGESDYLINKKPCRLSDINDLFMDTGMGTDSYSLFEQTMINSILSNKTEDRRRIFEEAAGITKYKARRKSALTKLIGIEDDLNRVGDIVVELERRTEALRRQAQRARRYRALKAEIREKSLAIAGHEIDALRAKMSGLDNELSSVRAALEGSKAAVSAKTAEIERLTLDIAEAERELSDSAAAFNSSMAAINDREKELARLDSRLESLREMAARARETAARNSFSLERLAENHGDAAGELANVTERLAVLMEVHAESDRKYRELKSGVEEKTEARTAAEREYRQSEQRLTAANMARERLRVMRESGERRQAEIGVRIRELEETIGLLQTEIEACGVKRTEAAEREKTLIDHLAGKREELETHLVRREEIDESIRDLRDRLASVKAEHDFLAELINSHEGYSEGIKSAAMSQTLEGRMHGILADLVSAEDRYLPALRTALSEYLNYVLVDDREASIDGARELTESGTGHAVFLGIDVSTADMAPLDETGVDGLLADLVRTADRFKDVIRRLLAGVYVVDSLDRALVLHERYPGAKFVTASGEMVGAYGEIHAGVMSGEGDRALGRVERLDTLSVEIGGLEGDLAVLTESRAVCDSAIAAIRSSIAVSEQQMQTARRELAETASSETGATARCDAASDSMRALTRESENIGASFARAETEEQAAAKIIADCGMLFAGQRERLNAVNDELRDLQEELARRQRDMNDIDIERAGLSERKTSLTRELAVIAERREALAQSSKRTIDEIERAEQESLEIGLTKQRLTGELKNHAEAHEMLRAAKDDLERRYADLRSARSDLDRELQDVRRNRDDISRRESSIVLQREEASMKLSNIHERIMDQFGLSPEEMPRFEPDREFDPGSERLIVEDLRRKMQALGDVNLAAEKDYEAEKARLDFLSGERDDLIDAGNTLKETIGRINQIARARFVETFERIRINFLEMFREFFEDGECDLSLEDGRDPLEADTLISARPPGKNVKSINLLSSGERALTAISLLFAIYMVKPTPFCILDEVDAPLDDANLQRFLKVIRKFSQRIQFIMVTHNKSTMAEADNLYGITMEEPGLSTLVSVKLSEMAVDNHAGENKLSNTVS